MQIKTVLALGAAVAMYFLPHVVNKVYFVPAVLISSIIPEVGALLKWEGRLFGKGKDMNLLEILLKNYLVCIFGAVVLAFSYPVYALPFFLGYSFSLTLNAFSKEGIQPFWPFTTKKTTGPIASGGTLDQTLFFVFLIFAIALSINFFLL